MQKEETKVMKSGQLVPGKLLSDKFVSYNELTRPLRPPSGKRIEGKLKKQIPKVKGQLPMSSSQRNFNSINPEQDAKLERMARPFSKGSNRPSSASKLSRSYSKENIKGKDMPYITAEGSKEGMHEMEDKEARNKVAECLKAHSKREMQRKVVHAAFEDISDSDAMSERMFEEMKGERAPDSLSMSTSLAEQEFDAALKVGKELVLYQPEENNAVVEVPSLEDQTHQSAMARIYAQVANLQKQAQEAKEMADGMMDDIQGRLDGDGQPLVHIPENFDEVINIVEAETRDEMIKRNDSKGKPVEKKLTPFWERFIKADPRTILDPEKRAKSEKMLKQLNKIYKQQVKLAKLAQDQREKKRQEKEKALREMNDQELRETYSTRSKEAERRFSSFSADITDPESDTFLTNMVGSAKKKNGRQGTPQKAPGGLDIINEEGTPSNHLSPALSKPNISKKNLHSQNTTRTDFSKGSKNFVEQNIKRAFDSNRGYTSMMNNLSDAERNRLDALMKEIEIEEPELRKLKTEMSFTTNRGKANTSASQSNIEEDRLTVISAAPSSMTVAKSMISDTEAKMIENIDNNLRQLVPIDKWEICSLKPHNQKTLSTIQDIESQVSDFTGLGVTSNVTGRTSTIMSVNSSNRRPKESVLREQSERRETISKLNSIDKNIATLIYQSSSAQDTEERVPETEIKELIENCKNIGDGGLGGPLEIVREEELNEGENPEMAAIMCQESILEQASHFARNIEQRIEEQRSRLLAIEVRQLLIQYKEENEKEQEAAKVQITEEELEKKIKNFDNILIQKSELVGRLIAQENELREMEEKMNQREEKMKSAKKAVDQSQMMEMKVLSQLDLEGSYLQFEENEEEEQKDRFQEMQREAKFLMREEDGELKRGQDGEIDLDNLVNNVSRLPICPIFKD